MLLHLILAKKAQRQALQEHALYKGEYDMLGVIGVLPRQPLGCARSSYYYRAERGYRPALAGEWRELS
jgi:hypothetical protein